MRRSVSLARLRRAVPKRSPAPRRSARGQNPAPRASVQRRKATSASLWGGLSCGVVHACVRSYDDWGSSVMRTKSLRIAAVGFIGLAVATACAPQPARADIVESIVDTDDMNAVVGSITFPGLAGTSDAGVLLSFDGFTQADITSISWNLDPATLGVTALDLNALQGTPRLRGDRVGLFSKYFDSIAQPRHQDFDPMQYFELWYRLLPRKYSGPEHSVCADPNPSARVFHLGDDAARLHRAGLRGL